ARIVAVNPLPEAGLLRFRNPQTLRGLVGTGTVLADLHLPIAVGSDLALFQLFNSRLVADGRIDRAFIDEHCVGFEELTHHLAALDRDALLAATGLDRALVDEAYQLISSSPRIVACWAMGLTQHRQ